MLTKGAIGNLVNRYKAVLKKCNLINTFGSLAVASMLVMGGAGVAMAADVLYGEDTNGIITLTKDKTHADVYGGAYANTGVTKAMDYDVHITVESGTPISGDDLYGGGWTFTDELDGTPKAGYNSVKSVLIDLNGGKIDGTVIGGANVQGYYESTGEVLGDTVINLNGTEITESIIGGGKARRISPGDMPKKNMKLIANSGDVFINVNGGSVNGIVGGGWINALDSTPEDTDISSIKSTVGDVTITVRGGVINPLLQKDSAGPCVEAGSLNAAIVGGGLMSMRGADTISVDRALKTGKITINILGGTINGSIIGGNFIEGDNNDNSDTASSGMVEMNIAGGTVDGTIYTGNAFAENAALDDSKTPDSKITLSGDAQVTGGIVAGDASFGDSEISESSNEAPVQVVLDSPNVDLGEKGVVRTSENVTVSATANFNDECANSEEALNKLAEITNSQEGEALDVAEGDINGAISIDKNGTIKQSKNTLMDAALQQASVTTVALDKILTNDVRKRLGDIRSDKNTTGVWMRWDGGKLKGSGLTNDFNTIQIGGDTKVGKNCRIGVAGSFTHGDADFARGNGELEGFSFALYSTWMGENGMFADVVARLGHFSTEMNVEGRSGDMDNRVASLSGEYGWRLPVCDQFFIEPQVELAYTYVSSEDLELGASKFQFDSVDSLTGRVGLVAGWNLPDGRGNVYARASVLQQFMGDAKVTGFSSVAPTVHETDGEDTWLEYGIGANVKLTDKIYIWADVERTEGADIEEEWRGTVGIRYSF